MIDYFQNLVEVGKSMYEKMNRLSEGMGSNMFKSEQNVATSNDIMMKQLCFWAKCE